MVVVEVVVVAIALVVVAAAVAVVVTPVDAGEEVVGCVVDVATASDVSVDELVRSSDEHAKMSCKATSSAAHRDREVTATRCWGVMSRG